MRIFFLFCLLIGSALAAERSLRVVELKSSLAAPVLEVIRPHLPAGAGASAVDNKLLLNISEDEWQSIKPIIEKLDQAPESLMVYVRIFRGQAAQQRRLQWRVAADSERGVDADLQGYYSSNQSRDLKQQQVRALAGQPAFIQVGEEIPYLTFHANRYGGVTVGTEFKSTGTGFYVLPRLIGDQVTAVINPEQVMPRGDGRYQTAVLQTDVRGALGQWLLIGGAQLDSDQRGKSYSTARDNWLVELKVEKSR